MAAAFNGDMGEEHQYRQIVKGSIEQLVRQPN